MSSHTQQLNDVVVVIDGERDEVDMDKLCDNWTTFHLNKRYTTKLLQWICSGLRDLFDSMQISNISKKYLIYGRNFKVAN